MVNNNNMASQKIWNSDFVDSLNELETILSEIDSDLKKRKSIVINEANYNIDVNLDEFKQIEKYTITIDKEFNLKRIKDYVKYEDLKKNNKDILFHVNLYRLTP